MPLYTYIVTYRGDTYITQDKKSNFKGFVSSWTSEIPPGVLTSLTPNLLKELQKLAYSSDFTPISGRTNVWRKTILLNDDQFVVIAVQTET
ncbi:MAG: hypothetical protein HC836_11165 [Richelia sp. RM2_1_2]|nr:hypothetical protein [Richelia sp. SM2_1_7]NJM23437.1 hypothetical protein [Richelia sp. SM1_7_0]NJN11270.1 hypothetical protein [Richelia sp. RM1_1_1]NJO30822.1 hypothetical protein [Richelia sp. SL_2_1]NJO58874.1 hypothetical protein [Richelia sp. RM2_1_2]